MRTPTAWHPALLLVKGSQQPEPTLPRNEAPSSIRARRGFAATVPLPAPAGAPVRDRPHCPRSRQPGTSRLHQHSAGPGQAASIDKSLLLPEPSARLLTRVLFPAPPSPSSGPAGLSHSAGTTPPTATDLPPTNRTKEGPIRTRPPSPGSGSPRPPEPGRAKLLGGRTGRGTYEDGSGAKKSTAKPK